MSLDGPSSDNGELTFTLKKKKSLILPKINRQTIIKRQVKKSEELKSEMPIYSEGCYEIETLLIFLSSIKAYNIISGRLDNGVGR